MIKDKSDRGSSLTDGLIITILEDEGPVNLYDSSPLSEDEVFNMVFKTITAIGSDIKEGMELREIRAYGPMPTGREPYLSLVFIFFLPTKTSLDKRITQFGRLIAFWIITRSTNAIRYIGLIKQTINRILQMYHINYAENLQNEDLLPKIDEKLKIIEGGIEALYVTEDGDLESFFDLTFIPSFLPIILIDNQNNKIQILLRQKTSPNEQNEVLKLVNDYRKKLQKYFIYKTQIYTDSLIIEGILSKAGFTQDLGQKIPFFLRTDEKLTYETLDFLIDETLFLSKNTLIKTFLDVQETKSILDLESIAESSGLSISLINEIINRIKKEGYFLNTDIKDKKFSFKT